MKLPWKRFWVPLGKEISCGIDGDGFFDDPEKDQWWSSNSSAKCLTDKDLQDAPFLVLLGEPGLGKSVSIEQAFPNIDHDSGGNQSTIWIRFRDIPDASCFTSDVFESNQWKSWLEDSTRLTLVLDGLDEGLIKIKGFLAFLTKKLRNVPIDRLNLRLTCRTADWPSTAGSRLADIWKIDAKTQYLWELCPLRLEDVKIATTNYGIDTPSFLEKVQRKSVIPLAARPTTLFFLIEQFKSSHTLGTSYKSIYQKGIKNLCSEPNPERVEETLRSPDSVVVDSAQIENAAAEIAALLIFSGSSAINTASKYGSNNADCFINEVFQSEERKPLGRNAINEALKTALFSSRGTARLGFSHQTFAEFLAARFACKLNLTQQRSLLCGTDGNVEFIIPQLAETAAWLCGINEAFLDHVLRIDPEVLLRSDVTDLNPDQKKRVIDAILTKANEQKLFNEHGLTRFFSSFKHPQLASQLRKYITDSSLGNETRVLAMEIAEDSKVVELEADLLHLLNNPNIDQLLREAAVRALEKILPDERLEAFEQLLNSNLGADPQDNLKGCLLRRLIPAKWSISDALNFITEPKLKNYYGAYSNFLENKVSKHIKVGDLESILSWLGDKKACFDSLSPYCDIAHTATCLAFEYLDRPNIREALVRFWVSKNRNDEYPIRDKEISNLDALWSNDERRRKFALYVFNDDFVTEEDMWLLLTQAYELLCENDLYWLLDRLPKLPRNRLSIYASVVNYLYNPKFASQFLTLLLQRVKEYQELKAKFDWLRAWDLNEPIAKKAKAKYLEDIRRQKEREIRMQKNKLKISQWIVEAETMIKKGKHNAWLYYSDYLFYDYDENRGFLNKTAHDIESSFRWIHANTEQRQFILSAARNFLINCSDGYKELGRATNYFKPGYRAVWLLRDKVELDFELRCAVSQNWIWAITSYDTNGDNHQQIMTALAYRLNPNKTATILRKSANSDASGSGYMFTWRRYKRCWNKQFSSILTSCIIANLNNDEVITSSLVKLVDYDKKAFLDFLNKVVPRIHNFHTEAKVSLLSCAHALAPSETWHLAWNQILESEELTKQVMGNVAFNSEFEIRARPNELNPGQLHELARTLYRLFPIDEKKEFISDRITSRQAIARYRNKITNQLTGATAPEAGKALLSLAQEFPDYSDMFMWNYLSHLKARRRTLWNPPAPNQLSEIIVNSESRYVSTEADLFNIVLEYLERFQTYYSKSELPATERLWRWEKEGNKKVNHKPKDEEDFSDEIARWLRDNLATQHVIIGREVQIEPQMKTDILIKCFPTETTSENQVPVTCVIEVKGCWNRGVRDNVQKQLVEKYMIPHGWLHGIYLVGWFVCEQWKESKNSMKSRNIQDAKLELNELCQSAMEKHRQAQVTGVILDCRYR